MLFPPSDLASIDRLTAYALSLERKDLVLPVLQSAAAGDAGATK